MNDRGSKLDPHAAAGDVYTQLSSRELRILLLGPGTRGSSIECEMRVVTDPKTTQYEALSYVWGDTTQSRTIHCNGFKFPVTESLYTAIDHLRYPDTWRRIWVDQLSINQINKDELMNQVGQMGAIYSSATRVIVWLGTCDKRMAMAWDLLEGTTLSSSLPRSDFFTTPSTPVKSPRRIPNRSCVSKYLNRRSGSRESLKSSTSSLSSLSSLTPTRPKNRRKDTPPSLKHALSIFQHVWFSRKWTFQEIVLADAAIICCGNREMAWADLSAWYFEYASKLRSSSLLYDSDGFFENILSIRNEVNKGLKLSNLLMLTRPRLSTKAEDVIYAILGLLPDLTLHLKSMSTDSVSLDSPASREKTLYDLYFSAFRYCLDKENDLAVLSAAGRYRGNSRNDGWPSWLPDWRQQLPLRPLVLTEPTVLGPEAAFDDETFGCSPSSPVNEMADAPVYRLNSSPSSDSSVSTSLILQGIRLGCIATRPGSWPSTYLIADPIARKQLASRKLSFGNQFSQSVSSLTSSSPQLAKMLHRSKSQGALNGHGQSYMDSEEQCESIRTSASVEAGDWLCAFRGGRVLYALRPLYEDELEDQENAMEVDGPVFTNESAQNGLQPPNAARSPLQAPLRSQYIGECAVHGLYPSDLFEAINATGEALREFELV